MRNLPRFCRVIAYGLIAPALAVPLMGVLWYGMAVAPA
nr:hypothetical protein [Kibdelosporangium sp. MJ126-NF4]